MVGTIHLEGYVLWCKLFFFPACFVIPYCCTTFIQLLFYFLMLVYLLCQLGTSKFYVFCAMHSNVIVQYKPTN